MSRLKRDDWAEAALEVLASGGVSAVAVEPLAQSLGTTKGSFYWHFKARQDLVKAALALWERRSTDEVIARVEASGGTAEERVRLLFSWVFDPHSLTGVDVRLLTHADSPLVSEVLDRVTRRRIDYVAKLLRQAGLSPRMARRRAVLAYSAFLGNVQLLQADPDLVRAAVGSLSAYADDVVQLLVRQP
ncbi:MAG: TetR/AcrR family transcriptional regulator [Nocardioidaceae bacterium]